MREKSEHFISLHDTVRYRIIGYPNIDEYFIIDMHTGKKAYIDKDTWLELKNTLRDLRNEESLINRLHSMGLSIRHRHDITVEEYYHNPLETIILEVTGRCNAKCAFCYAKDSRIYELSRVTIRKVLEEFKELGGHIVALTGGEPTLHPNLIDIIRDLRELGLLLAGIGTNGYNISDELITELKTGPIVDGIAISIDSIDESWHDNLRGLKGLCRRAKNAVQKLTSENIPVIINTLITRHLLKVEVIERFGDWLSDMGVTKWRLIQPFGIDDYRGKPGSPFCSTVEGEYEILFNVAKLYKEKGWSFSLLADPFLALLLLGEKYINIMREVDDGRFCVHRARVIYIRADGAILPCNIRREKIYGYVNREGLKKIWTSKEFQEFKRPLFIKPIDLCNSCPAKNICSTPLLCPVKDFDHGKPKCHIRLSKILESLKKYRGKV